jgi:hypothetical protein
MDWLAFVSRKFSVATGENRQPIAKERRVRRGSIAGDTFQAEAPYQYTVPFAQQ